jgi:hypothetical protein
MGLSTRITNNGTLYVNGIFDETSFSSTNPAIYNLVTYTEQFDNVVWAPTAALTITPNSINSPVGTLTADTLTGDGVTIGYFARGAIPFVAGTTYTFSCYFKAGTQSTVLILLYGVYFNSGGANIGGQFNLSTGSTAGSSTTAYGMTAVGNGWYRCWVSQICTASTANVNQLIRLGSVTGNLYAWGYQVEVASTPSAPTTYQGVAAAGTLVAPGFVTRTTANTVYVTNIFDEVTYNSTTPVIKNLYTYTEQFNNAYWSLANGTTVAVDAILSPIGTMTADKIQETSATSFWGVATNPTALFSTTYTCSIYAKAAERNQMTINFSVIPNSASTFTLTGAGTVSPGSATTCTITSVDNGWYRCTCTFTTPSSGSNLLYNVLITGSGTYPGTAGYGVYFWGAQLEIGSAATMYQGVAAAGVLVAPGFSQRQGSDGTMYVTNSYDEVTGIV